MVYGIRMTALLAVCVLAVMSLGQTAPAAKKVRPLPKADVKGKMTLEGALARRRSCRRYKAKALTRQQIAQLFWAAQGVTEPRRGFRTCPSAGALYPLELYVVTAGGVEHYLPGKHATELHKAGDLRAKLQAAALGQLVIGQAPATFVIAGVVMRTARKYGRRAGRYVLMEAGHAAQNILLQATALELGAVPVGAFRDADVAEVLSLPKDHAPLYLIPVGVPAK